MAVSIFDNAKLFRNKFSHLFIIDFMFIFLTNAILLRTHYSTDTAAQIISHDNLIGVNFGNSRFFYYIILKLLNIFDINLALSPIPNILTFIFFVSISIVTTYFTYLTEKYTKIKIIDLLVINISFVLAFNNVFILEWYFFPECMLMYILCLLMCASSISFLINKKNYKHYLISFVFILLAINTYQVAIGFYIIFGLLFIYVQNSFNFNLKLIKEIIVLCLIGATACILNQLFAILFINNLDTTRHATISLEKIISNISGIVHDHKFIWVEGAGLLPRYTMLLFLIILTILLFITFQKKAAFCLLLISGCYISVFLAHIFLSELWISHRSIVPLFSIFTLFIIFIMLRLSSPIIKKVLLILISCFLLLNTIQMQDITMNHFAANKLDIEYAMLIQEEIDRYEKMQNITVSKIGICNDKIPTYGYKNNIKYQSRDINKRAFITPWEFVPTLNVVNQKSYTQISMNDAIYNQYFKDKNWDAFYPSQQLIFLNDSVYIVMY